MKSPIVLMYHDAFVLSPDESGFISKGANHYKIQIGVLEEHLKKVQDMERKGVIDKNSVVFTFDDGGISFSTLIAPLLEKYGINGHFFVTSGMIGSRGFLDEKQIQELRNHGHIIGSHSTTHPENICKLSREERSKEWADSICKLGDILKEKITCISIPNGFYEKEDLELFGSLGITKVFTSTIGQNDLDNTIRILGRIGVTAEDSPLQIEKYLTSGLTRNIMKLKQRVLNLLKAILGNNYLVIKAKIRNIQN